MAAAPSAFKARRALPLTTAALLLIMRGVTCLILAACGATAAENAVNRKLLLSNSLCPSVLGYSATPDVIPDVDYIDVCFKGPNSVEAIAATCTDDPTCMGFTVTLPANAPDGSDIRVCFLTDTSGATSAPSGDTVCLYSLTG